MKRVGDYIVYRRDVCKIIDLKKYNNRDYYVLSPLNDISLHINVPVDNKLGYIRDLMSKEEVSNLISKISSIELIDEEDRRLEFKYKELLDSGNHEDLVKIIKTSYLRNKKRLDNNKKISEKDKHYFDLAEKYLYNEISIVLNKDYEETKRYLISTIEKK